MISRIGRRWELGRAGPSAYDNTRRKLALVFAGLNCQDGETYTLHSSANFLPAAATQMNFATRELNVIRRWSSNSRMGQRRDRSAIANELLLRNAIIQKRASVRNTAGSYRLNETSPGSERIGKDPSAPPATEVEPSCFPSTLPIVAVTDVPTKLAPAPTGGAVDDTSDGSLPAGPGV